MSERAAARMLGVPKAPPLTMVAALPLVDVEGTAFMGDFMAVAVLFLVDLRTPADGGGMDGVCKALVLGAEADPFFLVDLTPRFTCDATISATSSRASFKASFSAEEDAMECVADGDVSLFPE